MGVYHGCLPWVFTMSVYHGCLLYARLANSGGVYHRCLLQGVYHGCILQGVHHGCLPLSRFSILQPDVIQLFMVHVPYLYDESFCEKALASNWRLDKQLVYTVFSLLERS